MPGDPKECRQHALRCLELARTTINPGAKQRFVDLAATWQCLANQLESAIALLEEEGTPPLAMRITRALERSSQ